MDLTIKAPPDYTWVESGSHINLETKVGSLLVEERVKGDILLRKITLKASQAIFKKEVYGEFQQLLQDACGQANRCAKLARRLQA